MGEAAAGPGFGDFSEMEKEVVGWLLTRRDVKDCVEVAQAGNEEEATEMLLAVVQGLLQAQPKAKAVTKRAAKRKGPLPGRAEQEAESGQAKRRWLEDCTRALEADRLESEELRRAKSAEIQEAPAAPPRPVPLFWRIDLPEVLKVLSQQGVLPRSFLPVARPHVTLLYLGGEDEDRAAAKAQMSLQSFRAARRKLERLKGSLVAVKMTEIIIEENVACALVELPQAVFCGAKVPHLTLGTRQNVPARHCNDVLEEVLSGRTEGITRIKLPKPKELRGKLDLETSATYKAPN